MVIMENYFPQEKYRELWLKIDQLHLGYLEMEESTEKIIHRTKLEECIAEFLFLSQHREKFVFSQTEDVLYQSAAFKKDFSAYKAATGWNALQIYASNLLTQPWRKEYRQIKTYCGFYKHQIEANLVSAETIFEAMGYKFVGNGILILEGPICPDRVSNVSKDCLVAYVECQILKHIWEEVSPVFNLSWLDILDYRINYPGSLDQCVKNIKYKYNSKQFQPPIRSSRTESYETRHQPGSPTGQMSVANSHISAPNSHSYAALASHNHVALPALVPPVQYCVPHTNGCLNSFASYGYGTYPAHMPIVKQPLPATVPNGYYYPNPMAVPQPIYPVPTAQLIELDGRNGYDMVDEGPPPRSRRSRIDSNGTYESDRVFKNDIVVSQEPKQEVGEDWDYVYKDLEKQGYSKDLGERGDLLVQINSDKQRKSSKESKKMKATNLDEVMNSLVVNDRPFKMTEALEQLEKKPERIVQTKERRHSQGSSYENVNSNEALKQAKPSSRTLHASLTQTPSTKEVEIIKPKAQSLVETNKAKTEEKESPRKWECKSCTYLNDLSKEVCEMCSKSRFVKQEQPMEVGGPECSKCTLVNPRSEKKCQACGTCLKNSPTYI